MKASRGLRVVIADNEVCFNLMPDGIYSEKASEAIKKLFTRKLLQLAINYVAYQKTIIIMIASRGLRVFIADKEGCFVVMPVASIVRMRVNPLKTVHREAASANLCGLSENYRHHDSLRGLRVLIAEKEGFLW